MTGADPSSETSSQSGGFLRALARALWRLIPLGPARRGALAGHLFALAPGLFARTGAYRAWAEDQANRRKQFKVHPPLIAPREEALEGYVDLQAEEAPAEPLARAVAFYLPQFHPIPENDAWWGEGFTEWTKTRAAKPRFDGHNQPRAPGELGYYDLAQNPAVMARQAELAKLHGLSGFCFYFYWFAGKRLLETPIRNYFERPEIDFPFCLCWANENWSRRWDGRDDEILIAQDHSPEDDLAFIAHIADYMRDPRYMRVAGKPALLVYRPALLPDARATAARWRGYARENGLGDLHLIATRAFETEPPATYGFDAAVEFPPNNQGLFHEPQLVDGLDEADALKIYDWRRLAGASRVYETPPYRLYRGVNPQWDNTPRRPDAGAAMVKASPAGFQVWMRNAVADARARFANPDERLIFINAWNEWAEGAYLEPDQTRGYAYLEAARRALDPALRPPAPKIIVATHDLARHGAQFLALHMARTLSARFGYDVHVLSGEDGPLAPAFEEVAGLSVLDRAAMSDAAIEDHLQDLAARGFRRAIVNSSASGWLCPPLASAQIAHVALVHELPFMIKRMALAGHIRAMDAHAEAVVFPAAIVRDRAARAAGLAHFRDAVIDPQGDYKGDRIADLPEKERARREIVSRHALPGETRIVLGVGYGDARKAPDIFVDWALALSARLADVAFIWLGDLDDAMRAAVDATLAANPSLGKRIIINGFTAETGVYYAAADLFALSSREDPFPTTVLEALGAGAPAIVVEGAGGARELAVSEAVTALRDANAERFADAASRLLGDALALRRAQEAALDVSRARFGFASYMARLLDRLGGASPAVSVVVPNYNYAHFLDERLTSILEQTMAPREIIFLDDASSDDSLAVARRLLSKSDVNWRIIANDANSGDVFAQWRKGAAAATSPFVWIAEADDVADRAFLEKTSAAFEDDRVALSYCQSRQIDASGALLAADYQDYLRDVDETWWTRDRKSDGRDEIARRLTVKNTIPNVSAVLFRREALLGALERAEDLSSYRAAGDWRVYVELLKTGDAAFCADALNHHRRHEAGVTISRFTLRDLADIARMQRLAAQAAPPDDLLARRAGAYLDELARHFSLHERYGDEAIARAKEGQAPPAD